MVAGCSQDSAFIRETWYQTQSEGDRQRLLTKLNESNWLNLKTVEFSDFKVENSTQTHNKIPILGSYLKVVSRAQSEPYLIHLGAQLKLKKMDFEDFTSETLDKMHKELQKTEAKIISHEKVFVQNQSRLVPGVRFILEKKSGVLEKVLDSKLNVIWETAPASFFDVSTKIYPLGPKRSELVQVWLQDMLDLQKISTQRSSVLSGNSNSKIDLSQSIQFDPQDRRFDQVQAFFQLEKSLKWFEEFFNYRPFNKIEMVVNFGYPDKTNAAFYHGGKIRIGDGDGISYSQLALDPSIVIHESAHSVIEAVARLPFDGEGGSLNEGFADFFAAVQLNNPFLGEVSYLKSPFKRNLNEVVKLTEKNGGLYHDSLILSGLLWEIHSALGSKASLKVVSLLLIEMHPQSNFQSLSELLPKIVSQNFEPLEVKKLNGLLKNRGFQ